MADKPKTQNTLSAQEEQKEQPAQDEARAKRLAAFRAALDPSSPEYRPDIAKALDDARAKLLAIDFQPINDFLQELSTLEPFIKAELAKVPGGETLDDYLDKYTAGELLDMIQDPGSAFAKALETARATAGQQREKITQIGVPKRYQINQTLLNKLVMTGTKDFGSIINTGQNHKLPTYKQGRKQYYVTAGANSKNIKIYGETSEYDAAVANAVTTLINAAAEAGELPIFTDDQIARCMTGKVDVQEISNQTKKEVREALYRGNDIKLDVDATDEVIARGAELNGEKVKSFVVKNNPYFDFREIEIETSNGSITTAYLFKETPIISAYAQLTNGLQWIPSSLMDIKEEVPAPDGSKWLSVPSNKYRVCIVNYLLRRVYQANQAFVDYKKECRQRAKTGKKMPQRPTDLIITFASVFEAAGITSKNTITNAKGYVKTVMHYWARMGHIKGFTVRKKGKAEDAIILEYGE